MRAKKPLFVIVLTLILLAVALILPATAIGAGKQPVSWVKVNTNGWYPDSNFPDLKDHGATVARVEQLADDSLRGQVAVKVFREFYPMGPEQTPTLFRYIVKARAFTSPDYWDAPLGPHLAHADFFVATPDNWPVDLGTAPSWWASYKGAAVADFVAYVPVSQYPESLPWVALYPPDTPSIPYRFMFIDFGKSGKADVMLNWLFVGLPGLPWLQTVWTVPIQAGNIQVHVGR